ncbi:putative hydrolase or acyltransferase (alpha/beta hydrolase superfamily) [Vibrio nigripulchritudo SFn27]|uniref:Putative hydrolase or acyltransferase (Alpha/beta hydrolase superfamily) n=1 Tax=Vibrio nigripulchritudo TaxID=28173 RepID=U4K610_9VIBR|nr:alpha/beta hydrolase [Vibrio nigripulchritudo]CCN83416.1 putative hydrolase or acyltransferase (alpha/beta hydrolase superfamily) [Vibrio nigripulchritudo BLFn1]CCN88775.1 putative hydrolase or acyltransferase (alpha/beta hydrolase superfamily) [Vibrio nigripulchritudo SFn27]CCN94996.1 putative hydrolase or acyltransferase (alpha/beta hydrolase superfamily) [Vibrio nigripulchritudo ENn2]CCO41120.1 putative hydrolase or acyltransferase (alpha/beta hydrolase superfamily) [Vibrio nigripulchritu
MEETKSLHKVQGEETATSRAAKHEEYFKEAVLECGTIRYKDVGQGKVLLFLHGALANSNNWRKVLPELSKTYRCIAPDLPLGGHAIPLNQSADLSPGGICQILNQFLTALNLDSVVLVGNDTGGAYGQIFTAKYPERVSAMILSNCDALDVFPPDQFSTLPKLIHVPGYLSLMAQLFRIKPLLTSNLVLGLLSNSLTKEEVFHQYVYNFINNKMIRNDFKKVVNGWSTDYTLAAANALRGFDKPVSIVWATDDETLFPESLGRRLLSIFSNVKFTSVTGSLTYVHHDQPEVFIDKVSQFLNQLE